MTKVSDKPDLVGKRLGTREQTCAFLRENGFPITKSYFDKLSMPSANPAEAPPIACWWGRRALYDLDVALEWARGRTRSTRHAAASADQQPAA
jgi:hypothetical protein